MRNISSLFTSGVLVFFLFFTFHIEGQSIATSPKNVAIADGDYTSYVLKNDGTLWASGFNGEGQFGNNTYSDSNSFVQILGLQSIKAVAGGSYSAIALRNDGTVWAWGNNGDGELGNGTNTNSTVPVQVSGLTNVIAIASGGRFNLALKSDGTVWAWGYGPDGELGNGVSSSSNAPVQVSGLSGISVIACGAYHAMAIKSDGTVWTWGYNGQGQLGNGGTTSSNIPVQAIGLTGITAIAGGGTFSFAVKSDGTLWSWGDETNGYLGNGVATPANLTTPTQLSGVTGVIDVRSHGHHSLLLKSDGTVWAWGVNAFGQLGNLTTTNSSTPTQVSNLSGVLAISVGYGHSMALKSDGSLWCWGNNNDDGQDAVGGSLTQTSTFSSVSNLSGITALAGSKSHYLALKSDGTVWTWDDITPGSISAISTNVGHVAVQVSGLSGITALSSGAFFNLALKSDGTVWSWGQNNRGQLGNGNNTDNQTPAQISGLSSITAIACGSYFGMALKSDGTVWTWGYNADGELGNGTTTWTNTPAQISSSSLSGIVALGPGSDHAVVVKNDGTVWVWGANHFGDLGTGSMSTGSTTPVQLSSLSGITAVTAGYYHSVALKNDGTVWAWGVNEDGELGNGGTSDSDVPVQVSGLSGITSIITAIQAFHNVAVKSDGTVWTWGDNASGQLGAGVYGPISGGYASPTGVTVPVQVSTVSLSSPVAVACGKYSTVALTSSGNVVETGDTSFEPLGFSVPVQSQFSALINDTSISGGAYHNLLLQSNGTLWGWGDNAQGQLGNGTTTPQTLPVQVGITDVKAAAAGGYHSLAVKSDGSVWSWGANTNGQLGNNSTAWSTSPVSVSSLAGVISVAAGYCHSVALKSDGTVWTWGFNGDGELGNGTTSQSLTPVQVSGLTGIKAIVTRGYHTLALKSDGTIWAWGYNGLGELGDGTTTNRLTPVQVTGSSLVMTIAAGAYFSASTRADGTVWTWGDDSCGQLGDGATNYRNSPYQVLLSGSSLNNATALAAGAYHILVLRADGTLVGFGANYDAQLGDGTTVNRSNAEVLTALGSLFSIAAGELNSAAYNGTYYIMWGDNSLDQIGTGTVGGVPFVALDSDGNGLPDWWELKYFGALGNNPSALAPNGSGLTILQSYTGGYIPVTVAPAQPFTIAISATGPYQAPANPFVVTNITHPSTTTITHVDFYNGSTLLGSTTTAPWGLQLSNLGARAYIIKAIAYDNTGASVSATAEFQVSASNFYTRGFGIDSVYMSTIIAVGSEKGQLLDNMQGSDSNNNFTNIYPTSQYPLYPWFLRTLGATNELWEHISSISGGTPSYANFDVVPTAGGVAAGGAPPLVAFGSQGGGTPLYTNQSYNFGVAAGGQVVFAPLTISTAVVATGVLTTTTNHGLHIGQMIVINGAVGDTVINGTFLVGTVPAANQLTLKTPSGGAVTLSGTYTANSGVINSADIKVEVYLASAFASGTKIAPVYTQAFTVPRPTNAATWSAFVANSYVQDNHIVQTYSGNTIDFDTQVQIVPGSVATDSWSQQVNYPLYVTHRAANSLFYYKVSYMGITAPDDAAPGSVGTDVPSVATDSAMAVDSTGLNQVWNASYTLDFVDPSPWESAYINQAHFQSVALPSAYQGQSVDELIHNAPAVTDTLDAPGSSALTTLGLTSLSTVDTSPELRDHPVLDQLVTSLNNDPMALANYVLNQVDLTDAIGYDTVSGQISDTSVNPQGVSRDALATYLEGQGSPVEQDALLIYLLRKAGYPCGYVFPQQDQMLMFDEQLSKLLRMQIRGAEGPGGGENIPELIPVNYPWVAAYINGKWIHIFPWLKDTSVTEGNDLWSYFPTGYQTGGQWLAHYVLNDPMIRQLKTADGQYTDDLNVLFPLYAQNQLKTTGLSLDQVGTHIYNRQNYYTNWADFPRPWQTPAVTDTNLAQSLTASQNPSALNSALANIFDTISVQVISDRNNNGAADAGEPVLNTGTLRMIDLHDRRFLLYHQVTSTTGTNAPTYNLVLSLEPYSSAHTSGPYTFNSTSSYTNSGGTTITSPDNGTGNPGDLMNQQYISTLLQTKPSTDTPPDNDDTLLYKITYNRHLQAQGLGYDASTINPWYSFLGISETTSVLDTRYLRKGDMACLCLNYGRVSQRMMEFQAEKYWNYQQAVAANPSTPANPELAAGQLLFIMGESYYNKVSTLQQNVESWTKTHAISCVAHGLTKLSPARNSDDTPNLVNGAVNLLYPRVDMSYQVAAWVGNSTANLNSGDEGNLANNNADELVIGGGSADEHIVLNEFFQQAAAISTIKLLDIAQGISPVATVIAGNGTYTGGGTIVNPAKTISGATNANPSVITTSTAHGLAVGQAISISGAVGNTAINGNVTVATVPTSTTFTVTNTPNVAQNPGVGPLTLTASNYVAQGNVNYTANKTTGTGTATHTLSTWATAAGIWSPITTTLSGSSGALSTAYVTPGPVVAPGQAGQAFTGMGALTLGVGSYGAYISGNMVINNGGYGGQVNYSSFSDYLSPSVSPLTTSADIGALDLTFATDGSPVLSYTGISTPTGPMYSSNNVASTNFMSFDSQVNSSAAILDPSALASVNANSQELTIGTFTTLANTGATTATAVSQQYSIGDIGPTNWLGNVVPPPDSEPITLGGIFSAVYDPVNTITGEFYVNASDVVLNGPMPLEIHRTYGSLNLADNNFGYGWRMSYFPYLMLSKDTVYNSGNTQVTTAPTLIYAAEMDGSVIAYRKQTSPATRWLPQASDNPSLVNSSKGMVGGTANPFNNRIDQTTVGSNTVFTLTGSDGSVRTFTVQGFPTTGASSVSRARPYLQKWTDNRGNYYTFSFGTNSSATNYGQVNRIQSSNGNYIGFYYDTYSHITQAYTGDGRNIFYQYDGYGDLTQVTLPDASTISYIYQHATAAAVAGTALAGNGTYGASSAKITSDNNLVITAATNASPTVLTTASAHGLRPGQIVIISGATGNTAINGSFTVQTVPSSTTLTLLKGATPAAPYSTHLIVQETKPGGRVLQNTYNTATRQVLTQLATVGSNETPVQNASFNYNTGNTVVTDVNGHTTTYKYTSGQITEVDSPQQNNTGPTQVARQTWYTTTGSGGYQRSLATTTDKRGLVTTYTYDANGNLLTLKLTGNLTGGSSNTETSTTTMTYNSTTAVALPGGTSTVPNTIATISDQLGNGSSYTYGDTSHPYAPTAIAKTASGTSISNTLMRYQDVSSSGASAYGLLKQEIVAAGTSDQATMQYGYQDGRGFPSSKTQATGTSDPTVTMSYFYDLRGELVTETDAVGQSTKYSYDALGHRTGAQRYDQWGNRESWNYTYYNQNGQVEWEQGPRYSPNDYVYMQYDGAGRLSQTVKSMSATLADGSGVASSGNATTINHYDTFGNLTEIDDANHNATVMTYDAIGEMMTRVVHTGALTGTTVASESFTYEAGGEVATHTSRLGGTDTRTFTYTGKPKSDALPDGTTKSYLYDLTGRVVKETLTNGSYWTTTYNDAGRIISRAFFNSSGTQLMQESQTFDRRGNVISKTDVSGNTFTTAYDALNRVKTESGPPAAGTTAKQTVTHSYDAAGQVNTVTNGAGEKTVTYVDAEGRPTLISAFNSNGTTASNTGFWYSPDHQSVVKTVGTGTNAVTTTSFTDTQGHVVLVRHADGTWQGSLFDNNGNKTLFIDEVGATTKWTYDALNRVLTQTLPASTASPAVTTYAYTVGSGETDTRAMPGSLTAKTVFDNAGRKTSEELDSGASVTRKYTYTYYNTGVTKGLLQTIGDPRTFNKTYTYDAWLRPATINSSGSAVAQQNQNTSYAYDNRGMPTTITQSYAVAATGASTQVSRSYDAYGQLNAETTYLSSTGTTTFTSGNIISQWAQSWNSAGRRSALNWQMTAQGVGAGSQYAYSYNGNGQLTDVNNSGVDYTYSYGDNGLLTQRNSPLKTQTITARDGEGRVTAENTASASTTQLTETMTYRGDSRLNTYSVSGPITSTETRTYGYDIRGRVMTEPYVLANATPPTYLANGPQTSTYYFDQATVNGAEVENGLGVRTTQVVNADAGDEVQTQNAFKQPTGNNHYFGDGTYAPWTLTYDGAGETSTRSIVSGGTTYNLQTLVWDGQGRMVKTSQRNTGTSDFDSTNVYDGLGRRVQTTWQPMNSGVNNGAATTLNYYYDPQVEFLELGLNNNGGHTWRVYGPDRSGVYGGAQGEGGLENEINESSGFAYIALNNYFGDELGTSYVPNLVSPAYFYTYGYGSALGGYGYELGSQVYSLSSQWRGRYLDWTGFIYKGARYYDYQSGKFLSCDPMGHAASMSLYDYCGGDPVNGLDPDGRLASYAANNVEQTLNGIGSGLSSGLGSALSSGLNSWGQASNDQSATWQALADPNTRGLTAETMLFSAERSMSNFVFSTAGSLSAMNDPTGVSRMEFQALNGYANQEFDSIAQSHGFSYDSPAGRTAAIEINAASFGASFAFGGGEAKIVEDLAAEATPRGVSKLSDLGGLFTSSNNSAGGEVWTSVGNIARKDFSSMVNNGLYKGEVNVISGVHGDPLGGITVDPSLYEADVAKWGNVEGVTIHNFTELTPEQINSLLNQPGTTIGGFCNSEAVLAPFR